MQTDTSSNPCSMDLLAPGTRVRHWRSHPWSCFLFPGGDSTGQRWLCCPGASPTQPLPPPRADPRCCVTLLLPLSGTFPSFAWAVFQRHSAPLPASKLAFAAIGMTVTSAARGSPLSEVLGAA